MTEDELIERKRYVIEETERLIGTDWPPNIARRLDYDNPHSLKAQLKRWGRADLAAHFDKIHYDGLVSISHLSRVQNGRGE